MATPELRDMRATDIVKHSRYVVPRFAGVVAEIDGREIGAAAIVIGDGGRPFLCLEISDELRRYPNFMHRVALKMTQAGVEQMGSLYTIMDENEPTSERWLNRLGFADTGETVEGRKVFKWRSS